MVSVLHPPPYGTRPRRSKQRACDTIKAYPIQRDEHLLTVVRDVERDASRVGLVERAEEWPRSSLRPGDAGPALDPVPVPVPRGADRLGLVNAPRTEAEVAAIRLSLRRDRPRGIGSWSAETAALLGLEYSLRPRGHPPRRPAEAP